MFSAELALKVKYKISQLSSKQISVVVVFNAALALRSVS